MKKILPFLLAGLFIMQGFTFSANELTREERNAAISYFKETRDFLTEKVKGLSDQQLDFKSTPDKWSIRQCLEHIALSETFITTIIEKNIQEPANPGKRAEIKFKDEELKSALLDRSKKGQAPEPLQPSGKFQTAAEAISTFVDARNKNITYLDSTKDDLRNHLMPHPFFGMLDSYQWMLLLAGHGKRHTLQIAEVKADPGFPKE
jgi:hypothetical protein